MATRRRRRSFEAQAAIDRLAAVPTHPGFVPHEIALLRLRALLARAHGDEASSRDHRDRYRAMTISLGFEGQIEWAEAMTRPRPSGVAACGTKTSEMVKCEDAHAEQLALHFGGDRQAATGLLDRSESGRDHAVRTNGDFFLAHACNRERARLPLCDKFVRAHPHYGWLATATSGLSQTVGSRRRSPERPLSACSLRDDCNHRRAGRLPRYDSQPVECEFESHRVHHNNHSSQAIA